MNGSEAGIVFEGVWKKFRRGQFHDSLRDIVPATARRLMGRGSRSGELSTREFWALQDIGFQVGPGEALGIIGANGAGKSTILKTMTKILRPNRGRCTVRGRIGALIEVAAGFHPDLTGRENVFLQGAIMNMPAELTRQKFEEIVEFSGISDFIDTPVKRYSSGMNARLGFAIAAHLDPDVLVIDEVLSVGDYAFQRRAFERIGDLARSGIPVVIVSHQLDRIAELSTKAVLVERGRMVFEGDPQECIGRYVLGQTRIDQAGDDADPIRIDAIACDSGDCVRSGSAVQFGISGRILREPPGPLYPAALRVRSLIDGKIVFACDSTNLGVELPHLGSFVVRAEIELNVPPGNYLIETAVWDPVHHRDAFTGPALMLKILEGQPFWGSVQMNPRMWLVAESSPAGAGLP